MNGFTEIHSHFLYGMDDGARSKIEMEAMLDAAYTDGIASLFATPHITPGVYPLDKALLARRLNEARSYCRSKGYRMNIYGGAEVLYTPALRDYVIDHQLPTLDDSDYVLMEFVPDVDFKELQSALELMERYGYIVVIAHIERYGCLFQGNRAARLKEQYDVRYQVNANTVLTKRGFLQARRISGWFEKKLIDFVASDAHDTKKRPFRMKEAYGALCRNYGQGYAEQLTKM